MRTTSYTVQWHTKEPLLTDQSPRSMHGRLTVVQASTENVLHICCPVVSAERWDGDEEQEEAEDLQTMVDKRYSGINAARSNSGFEINVPNILVQSASMDEPIHAYYNSSFVPDSASQQRCKYRGCCS